MEATAGCRQPVLALSFPFAAGKPALFGSFAGGMEVESSARSNMESSFDVPQCEVARTVIILGKY